MTDVCCLICGKTKIRGTITVGKIVKPFWMCGTLQMDHDEMRDVDEIDWEDDDEMDWGEV